jgi:hypothetical protein
MAIEPSHGSNERSHVLDGVGPTAEFMVLPSECKDGYCVIKGTIPQSVSVPIHSHPDDKSFLLLSGHCSDIGAAGGWFRMGNHECWRFSPCASGSQARMEKPIE